MHWSDIEDVGQREQFLDGHESPSTSLKVGNYGLVEDHTDLLHFCGELLSGHTELPPECPDTLGDNRRWIVLTACHVSKIAGSADRC